MKHTSRSSAKPSSPTGLLTDLIKEALPTLAFSGKCPASEPSDTFVGTLRDEHLRIFHLYECALLQHRKLKAKIEKAASVKVKPADYAKHLKRFDAQMRKLAELQLQADTWKELFWGSVRVFFYLYDPTFVLAIRQGGKVVILKKEGDRMSDMMTVPGIVLFGLSRL